MSLSGFALLAAIIAGLVIWEFAYFRFRAWYRRNEARAPAGMQYAVIAAILIGLLLAATDLVPPTTSLPIAAGLSLVAVIWGLVRYHRSPYLRRWEEAWKEIDAHLKAGDESAADRVMTAAFKEDDSDIEQLRAAAPLERRAAFEFQRRTKAELQAWNRTAERVARPDPAKPSNAPVGSRIFTARKQRLEADLEWVNELLSNSSGAA